MVEDSKSPEAPENDTDQPAIDNDHKPTTRSRRQLTRCRTLAYSGILLGVFLFGQELMLRGLFPVPEIANLNRVQYSQMFHSKSERAGSDKFLSNSSYIHASDPDGVEFVHSLNLYGFRDRKWSVKKPKGHHRVMFFGDSFTEGAMAADDYTIPEGFRLAADLQGEKFDVMNLGVQAMGLPGYINLMADTVPLFKPDSVVIVFFENDFHSPQPFYPQLLEGRGVPPEYNSHWTPRIVKLLRNIYDNQPNPRRWITSPFSFFAAVPNPRNPLSNGKAREFYSQFIDPGVLDAMARGRFNPYIVDSYLSDEEELRKPVNVSNYLMAYQDFLEDNDCRLYTTYIPVNNQVSDYYIQFQLKFSRAREVKSLMTPEYNIHRQTLAIQCEILDIPFIDFTPLLQELESKGQHMYWDHDNHMKGESYLFLGDQIFEWFQRLGNDGLIH